VDAEEFRRESQLAAIQRGLQTVGVFSFQCALRGRTAMYAQFIRPTLQTVLDMAAGSGNFPAIRDSVGRWLADGTAY
jgi:hypothetical protein